MLSAAMACIAGSSVAATSSTNMRLKPIRDEDGLAGRLERRIPAVCTTIRVDDLPLIPELHEGETAHHVTPSRLQFKFISSSTLYGKKR